MTIEAEYLIPEKQIPAEVRRRLAADHLRTIPFPMQSVLETEGWVVSRRNKKSLVMRKRKTHDVAFEDRVWSVFAKMQFPQLNKDRRFTIAYGDGANERRQIDVFAADDETVLIIECKSFEQMRKATFKTEVEAIQGTRPGLIRSIKQAYPGRKVRFVLATNNAALSKEVGDRIAAADIIHLDEDAIDYYLDLANHLGKAARYQLLGALFDGVKIPGMEPTVPAIQGKMGGHTYYSFSIEPDRLLKLGFVLHRHKANSNLMPTYQRLIKKSRLKNIAGFVDGGGFFPNSIIINIESGKRGLRFENLGRSQDSTKIGILHLPQTYRAAYIIDGQHRLYGYAGTGRAATEVVPVIAFTDLTRSQQVELFMQINENQQPVPKSLQNTLNADLLWESPDLREQAKALRLRLAQALGENKTSPLYGRVLIGEGQKSALRCLTIEAIGIGLDRGNFMGSFTKSEVREVGTFYRGSNQATFDSLSEYLELCFDLFRRRLPLQYDLGSADGGFVFMNVGVEALLRLFSDVADHLVNVESISPRLETSKDIFESSRPLLEPVIDYFLSLSAEEGSQMRRMYGSAGRAQYWRRLQIAVNAVVPRFDPPGLSEYVLNQEKEFNTESFNLIRDIEQFLNHDIRRRLEDELGASWFKKGVPLKVYEKAYGLAAQKNRDREPSDELHPWDCLHLIDYQAVVSDDHDRWVRLFEAAYTRPGDEKRPGGWKGKSHWITELNRIRNENFHTYSVSETEYDFLIGLHTWLDLR